MTRPVVSLGKLAETSPPVSRWVHQRLGPKVLVASQTRIVEPALDRAGDCVPVTPVISVEPRIVGPGSVPLEALAAVLAAPSTSARVAMSSVGTGRSTGSLRISASVLAAMPVPTDLAALQGLAEAWAELEATVTSTRALEVVGARIDHALGIDEPALVEWWAERAERRRHSHRGGT